MELHRAQGSDARRFSKRAGLQLVQHGRALHAERRMEQADVSPVCRQHSEQALLEGHGRELRRHVFASRRAHDGAALRAIWFLKGRQIEEFVSKNVSAMEASLQVLEWAVK